MTMTSILYLHHATSSIATSHTAIHEVRGRSIHLLDEAQMHQENEDTTMLLGTL